MGKGCGEGWGTTKTETTANVRAQSGPASPGRGREEFPSSCKDVSSKYAQARYRARRGLGKGKGVPCPLIVLCPFSCPVGLGCPCLEQSHASICSVQDAKLSAIGNVGRT